MSYAMRVCISVCIKQMAEEQGWAKPSQGMLLSAYYFGYCTTMLLGGTLSVRFGAKKILWLGLTASAICALLTPFVVASFAAVAALRVVMGLSMGPTFPCLAHLITKWFPRPERNISLSFIWSGSHIGTVFVFFVGPYMVESSWGWESVFYMVACITFGSFYSLCEC